MADILADGLAFLTRQFTEYVSEPATYARGYDAVDVRVTLGKKLLKLEDADGGIRMEWTDLDACIPTADFDFGNGVMITPERGDLLYVTIGNHVQVFEAFPYGGTESVWRWADPIGQTMVRIHFKHIDSEGPYY